MAEFRIDTAVSESSSSASVADTDDRLNHLCNYALLIFMDCLGNIKAHVNKNVLINYFGKLFVDYLYMKLIA